MRTAAVSLSAIGFLLGFAARGAGLDPNVDRLCGRAYDKIDRAACLQNLSSVTIDRHAADACSAGFSMTDKIGCFKRLSDQFTDPSLAEACSLSQRQSDRIDCLEGFGYLSIDRPAAKQCAMKFSLSERLECLRHFSRPNAAVVDLVANCEQSKNVVARLTALYKSDFLLFSSDKSKLSTMIMALNGKFPGCALGDGAALKDTQAAP